jgi:anti-sigma28 factor (negative regulator of flagellin synthesis)
MSIGTTNSVRQPAGVSETGKNRESLKLEKLKAIRKRIASGFYNRQDIVEKLAEKLTDARELASNCFEILPAEPLDAAPSP